MYLYTLLLSDLAGTGFVSSSYLGVDDNSTSYARRKSDSRLDTRQVAHLKKVATSASNTSINNLRDDRTSRGMDRNEILRNYHEAEKHLWSQQENLNSNSLRGDSSSCSTDYVDVEYNLLSNLGPFQMIPPQIHYQQHVDGKFVLVARPGTRNVGRVSSFCI